MIVSVSGHRPDKLGGYGAWYMTQHRVAAIARDWLQCVQPERLRIGMAQGWDQCCAAACVALGIPFDALLPYEKFDEEWPDAAREMLATLLSHAASVTVVVKGHCYDPSSYHVRNREVLRGSDLILAMWNGEQHGGTWATMKYNNRPPLVRPVVNLWPIYAGERPA